MEIIFTKNFLKILEKTKNDLLLEKIKETIVNIENVTTVSDILNVKKMTGYQTYYRIKVGNYRIGFELLENTCKLLTVLHRKDIYKKFP